MNRVAMFFSIFSLVIVLVVMPLFVKTSQTANINLQSPALGNIEEGETRTYTKNNMEELDDAITMMTTKDHVYLQLESDLDRQKSSYEIYIITLKYDIVPIESSHSSGETACILTLASPNYNSIELDVNGTWTFDFEITTTASSVSSDTQTTVTIIVTVENT